MKLAIVTTRLTKGDGQGRVNYEVARAAAHKGIQVTLLASEVAHELGQHENVNHVYIPNAKIPTTLLSNALFSLRSCQWLAKHRSEFDIVQTNGAISRISSHVNAVHFVHSSWLQSPAHTSQYRRDFYGLYQWIYTALNARWERQAFQRSKTVVAVSEKVKKELVDIGVPIERIRVILNGVDLDEFSPGFQKRGSLGLPEDVPIALFAGDLQTPRKNLDSVLQVLTHLDSLHLVVVGKTDNSPYPAMACRLGLKERVHFLGYRRDVADIMRASDVFIFPSRYEACTLVLLEALASGLPVITASTAGGAEVITAECGYVLDSSENVEEMVSFTQKIIASSELRERMGKAGRRVAEHYSWSAMAQKYIDLYLTMTNQ